jgi:3-hydroxy-9,10-secoandrosta-1,3,5(10)-triene-9,17-dione monooxygenase
MTDMTSAAVRSVPNAEIADDEAAAFLRRIDGIVPILKAHAAETERLRRLSDASIAALGEAGVFRAGVPHRWGGTEIDPVTWYEAVVRIGTACPSSAWVAGVVGGHSWHAAMFPEAAQRELWGAGEDVRIATSFAPTGKVARVEGGFHVHGRWKFLSGVDHSQWIMVGGVLPDEGEGAEYRSFLLPASGFAIDQGSWHVEGLQGTGSKDVVVDCIVPAHRTQTIEEVYNGTEPGKDLNTGPIFQLPWLSRFSYAVAMPAVGALQGAIDAFLEENRGRVSALTHKAAAENTALHVRLAEASVIARDTRARIAVTWGAMYETVKAGGQVSTEERVRCRFEGAYAVAQCLDAAMKIFQISGGGVLDADKSFQLYLRGIMGMRNHPFNVYETWAPLHASALLGSPPAPPLMRHSMGCLL